MRRGFRLQTHVSRKPCPTTLRPAADQSAFSLDKIPKIALHSRAWGWPTRFLGHHDQTVRLEVPDDVFVYWLKEHYQPVIIELLSEQLGFEPELEFVVNAGQEEPATSRQF